MTLNQTDVNTLEEVISMIEDIVNYDPTPYYLYDNSGGEAPMTANELSPYNQGSVWPLP